MRITEVCIQEVSSASDRVRAYCTITIDDEFVIRDLKVIEGNDGLFVAMPSRPVASRCEHCRNKNDVRHRFCGCCGRPLDSTSRRECYDIAHPINIRCREKLESAVLTALSEKNTAHNETKRLIATK